MKLDRVGNAKKGIAFGTIKCVISLLLPFIIRTITIHILGIEYAGIKGLFSAILTIFSLAELGFGSAVVYAMYEPIAKDDIKTICALLKFYRKVYLIIGLCILFMGIILIPFLNLLINGSYPEELNIEIVFILYLMNTVSSYLFLGYKTSLLNAYQRTDVLSIVKIVIEIITFIVQVLVLVLFKDFYWYLIVVLASTILNNIVVSLIVNKMFPNIRCEGTLDKSILKGMKKRVGGLIISKICGISRNSFDNIFLSAFLGLTVTAIYSNYYFILSAVNSLTLIIVTSVLGGVGNSIAMESKEKNYADMIKINNIYMVIGGIFSICILCVYQPFMRIWMGSENMFPDYIMFLFPLYFYVLKIGDIRAVYSDAAGLFWENRYRCIAEAAVNLVLNFVLGKMFGVVGIMAATLFSLFFIGFFGSTRVIFKHFFIEGKKRYYINQFFIFGCTILIAIVTYCICSIIRLENRFLLLIVRGLLSLSVSSFLFWIITSKTKDFEDAKNFIAKTIRRKRS